MAARTWYTGQIQQLARCTFREAELLGNRILLMSRSKTLIPCSPLTFLSLFIAITMVASSSGL